MSLCNIARPRPKHKTNKGSVASCLFFLSLVLKVIDHCEVLGSIPSTPQKKHIKNLEFIFVNSSL